MAKRRAGIQIDSRPLKVENGPDLLVCRWHATYRWKAFDEGYNFASDLTLIGGFHTKLWASKVARNPILGISGLPLGSPGTKWHLGVSLVAKNKVYYKGEGSGFPQVRAVVSLVSPCLPVARSCTKIASTMHWLTCYLVYACPWTCLSFFLIPIPELQHAPLPPKCYKPRSAL
jgi:hypothetical protein